VFLWLKRIGQHNFIASVALRRGKLRTD
jgi:hypothetical protein